METCELKSPQATDELGASFGLHFYHLANAVPWPGERGFLAATAATSAVTHYYSVTKGILIMKTNMGRVGAYGH